MRSFDERWAVYEEYAFPSSVPASSAARKAMRHAYAAGLLDGLIEILETQAPGGQGFLNPVEICTVLIPELLQGVAEATGSQVSFHAQVAPGGMQ